MELSLSDAMGALSAARQIDPNPVSLAGRMLGLSEAEIKAGIPTWAWVTLGFGVGVGLTAFALPRAKMLANSMPWISSEGAKPNKAKRAFGRWRKK